MTKIEQENREKKDSWRHKDNYKIFKGRETERHWSVIHVPQIHKLQKEISDKEACMYEKERKGKYTGLDMHLGRVGAPPRSRLEFCPKKAFDFEICDIFP